MPSRAAFQCIATSASVTAISASANHTASQASVVAWRMAMKAATSAVTPMAQYPQPETAVNVVLRSMVCADHVEVVERRQGSGGSQTMPSRRCAGMGVNRSSDESLGRCQIPVKYFVLQSNSRRWIHPEDAQNGGTARVDP